MTEIADWFRSLPVFTRYWFGLSVVFPILGRFRLVNPQYLVLTYDLFVKKFQVSSLFLSARVSGGLGFLPVYFQSLREAH